MRGKRSTPALAAVLLVACAPILLHPAPAATAAEVRAGATAAAMQSQPRVAKLIRAALAAGRRGDPLPRPLVNEKGLINDVWQRWWTCSVDFDHHRGPICPLGDRRARRTVVVYGDSHAGVWLPALDRMGSDAGFRVVPLIKYSCAPFDVAQRHDGRPYTSCPRFRRWAERKIARLDPAMVLVGYRGFWAVDPTPGETVAHAWQQGARTAVRRLVRHTPQLVILGDVSSKGQLPRKCLRDPHADMGTCTTRVEPAVNQANRITQNVARAARARFVATQNLACAKGRCPLVVDKIVTYRDPSHLSMTWTNRIAVELRNRIRPPRADAFLVASALASASGGASPAASHTSGTPSTGDTTARAAASAAVTAAERVSVSTAGDQGLRWSGHGWGLGSPDVSADGRYVAFASRAPNLVPGDTNGKPDIFVRDTVRHRTVRVSIGTDGQEGNDNSSQPFISADGRYIAFTSQANTFDPRDPNFLPDAYVHDRVTHRTELISFGTDDRPLLSGGWAPAVVTSISDDGQRVVFESHSRGGPGDGLYNGDVFVRDLAKNKTILVSHRQPGQKGGADANKAAISGNGRYVVFRSIAKNLLPPGEPRLGDIWVRDLRTDELTVASAGFDNTKESRRSEGPEISGNGKYVVFKSRSRNLLEERSRTPYWTLFVRDLATGETWRLASSAGRPTISADGSLVAFTSVARLVADDDTVKTYHVYVWNRATETFTLVNRQPDGTISVGDVYRGGRGAAVTPDGTTVVFTTKAADLIVGDTNTVRDVYIAPADAVQVPPTAPDLAPQAVSLTPAWLIAPRRARALGETGSDLPTTSTATRRLSARTTPDPPTGID